MNIIVNKLKQKNKQQLIKYINDCAYIYNNGNKKILDYLINNTEIIFLKNKSKAVLLTNILLAAFPRSPRLVNLALKYAKYFYNNDLKISLIKNQKNAFKILSLLRKYYKFKTLVDFGCGPGSWIKAANKIGLPLTQLVGIDKFYDLNKKFTQIKKNVYEVNFKKKFDLAVCIEVGEHIYEKKSYKLIKSLTSSSDVIIFSAATLNQSGDAHINCQKHEYWYKLFFKFGYECVDFFRPFIWNNKNINNSYKQNCFLYLNIKKRKILNLKKKLPVKILYDVEHPSIINEHYLNRYRDIGQKVKISLRKIL
jgi:2-polyprenyl-3-methyl-5-hydroxy-6-metoxy-1,4-benzoquinol methylase